ncbi:hypothetical protein COY52_00565 [Candidatus Desantisbacteria bacterium CG_4_10_14_0_8_um_filter_48_22]|uniref:CBS domain-containing protein n=1 Tax=Candidatus Desantisbacteria bacterium CG_4_10_14_0_8_um_filter_48_22 TaxID=1974543 RepID=A0A2M7SFE7_9BACT|nr:MAG: hypothetical protein AUJ67_03970 [Candidatus Desantisbacteria bacterium CG1_02_49_89]PIV57283.1 MAG: hypothetical protein COS16_01100 [Candidatus Desantisbacteria bacterium CG02_land_8_20_14_3_00_49_13]PIZ18214.1 MAG: hypothetical protein COY52_00565 [Candidatus Desantisbacteria bacterium CG_4_10_14_0_8_um_filter_48_22]
MLASKVFVFFTELTRQFLLSKTGKPLGRIFDLIVDQKEMFPRVISVVVSTGVIRRSYAVFPWEKIQTTDECCLITEAQDLVFKDFYQAENGMSLRRDILDKQIVDTLNRKVVRVNDIHLLRAENNLHIAHVDIGMRGLLRRLDLELAVDNIIRFFRPDAKYLENDMFISWKYVQPLAIHPIKGMITLSVSQEQLSSIPPAELGDIILGLDVYERVALFRSLDIKMKVKALLGLEAGVQKSLVEDMDPKSIADILNLMPPDNAADLLGEFSDRQTDSLFNVMESDKAKKLAALLGHEAHSAGGLMTTEFITLPENITVEEAINRIKGMTGKAETIYYGYIVDDARHLIGMTTFRHLLFAQPQKLISEIMIKRPVRVHLTDTARKVAFLFDKYGLLAIPVVNGEAVIHGIITVDDILGHIIQKAYKKRARKPKL